MKIKIYCDTGADIKFLKPYLEKYNIELFNFPYDTTSRSKKLSKTLAMPSACTWEQANVTCEEAGNFTYNDFSGSIKYEALTRILGTSNLADINHIDSAYKTECQLFLTSDKRDILSKKEAIEYLYENAFTIFFHKDTALILEHLELLFSKQYMI